MPARRRSSCLRESFPTLSDNRLRSMVTICEAFATESFGRPIVRAGRRTFPGASAQPRLPGQWHAHDGRQLAAIEGITLYHDHRATKARAGANRVGQVRPADIALGGYHSVRPRTRRAAAATKASAFESTCSTTRSMDSVIESPSCRARGAPKRLWSYLAFPIAFKNCSAAIPGTCGFLSCS